MRRMFRLSDASHKDIDLREYEDEILEIADRILLGKNPKVYQNYFMTDELIHRAQQDLLFHRA